MSVADLLENVYLRLPIVTQHAVCSCVGWRIQRQRYEREFAQLLREYEDRLTWTSEEVAAYRDRRLRMFIRCAVANVPHYRELFRDRGLTPDDIQGLADLSKLPILTKAQIQESPRSFQSRAVRRHIVNEHTSGTTGAGLQFVTTVDAIREQWAVWWRYRRMHQLDRGTWCGFFGGRSVVPIEQRKVPFWRFNAPGREIFFSAYHLSCKTFRQYVDMLNKRKPPWLHGYPSFLSLLANYMLEADVKLDYQPRWITTGAENLSAKQADAICRAFGTLPIQHYGTREAVANISMLPDRRMVVDEDFCAVEFVPIGDGRFRIIGTNLSNSAMPMIRYDVGDIVELPSVNINRELGTSSFGRVVTNIDGRSEDYVVLANGATVGRLDHIFKDMTAVRETQIHQYEPGRIRLFVVKSSVYTRDDESKLLSEARKRLGSSTIIELEYVERIPRTKTGKFRLVVSDLTKRRMTIDEQHTAQQTRAVAESAAERTTD